MCFVIIVVSSFERVKQKCATPAVGLQCLWSAEGTAVGEIFAWAEGLTEGQHPHRLQITEEATLPCRAGPAVMCCGL